MAESTIQITSTILVKPAHRDQALQLAIDHVAASRKEAGCLRHEVFVDPGEPTRFFFFERWRDQEALNQHFREPYSMAMAAQMKEWAAAPMTLEICEIKHEQQRSIG